MGKRQALKVTEVTLYKGRLTPTPRKNHAGNMQTSTRFKRTLLFAALMTCGAVLMSEWQGQSGPQRLLFSGCVAVFAISFLTAQRASNSQSGWSFALALQAISAMSAVALGGFGMTPALYVILSSQLYERLGAGKPFWLLLTLMNAVLLWRLLQGSTLTWALSGMAAYAGFQMFGLIMASNARDLQTSNDLLRSSHAELSAARALLSESARAEERLHLSRELHDVCGHKLTALKLTLRASAAAGSLQGETLALTQQLTDELLSDIRSVVSTLRAHEGIDLSKALHSLAALFQTPKVTLKFDKDLRVPALGPAQALLRTAQEALTNAAKHGAAKNVQIALRQIESELQLCVVDDGRGRLPIQPGNGLRGMQERIEEQGGSLVIQNNTGTGLSVTATLPIMEASLQPSTA